MTETMNVQLVKATIKFRIMSAPYGVRDTKAGPMFTLKTILNVYDPEDLLPIDPVTEYKETIWMDVIAKNELASELDALDLYKGDWMIATGDLKFGMNSYKGKVSMKATLWAATVVRYVEEEENVPPARRTAKPAVKKAAEKKSLFEDDED